MKKNSKYETYVSIVIRSFFRGILKKDVKTKDNFTRRYIREKTRHLKVASGDNDGLCRRRGNIVIPKEWSINKKKKKQKKKQKKT